MSARKYSIEKYIEAVGMLRASMQFAMDDLVRLPADYAALKVMRSLARDLATVDKMLDKANGVDLGDIGADKICEVCGFISYENELCEECARDRR